MMTGAGNAQKAAGPNANTALPSLTAISEDEAGDPQDNAPTREFDIHSSALSDALDAYKRATGLKVKFKVPAEQVEGFRSEGVHGTFTDAAALRTLLANTGLGFHVEGDTVEISIRNAEHVDVTASIESAGLQQFTEPLLDTAQTVNVVPQFIMQEQAVTNLRDGLRNVPGISLAAGENGAQGDNLTIRGFTARNDIYLDGIRDFGSYYRDAFDYESIDVLEGPAGVEFGRGSTGGVVNQETKVPSLQEHIAGNLQLGTDAMRLVTVDVNEPLQSIPGGAAFRLNLAGMQNNVSGRDTTNVSRFGIAPSLAFGLNKSTRAFITYLHEGENDVPDYGLPYFGIAPAPVARSTFYGYANGSILKTSPDIVSGKVEHDFSKGFTLRNQLRWANYPRTWNIIEPQINTTPVYTQNATTIVVTATCSPTATTPCYALNTPISQVMLKRNILNGTSTEDMLWDQMSFLGHVNVGHVENNFVVIGEGGRERSRPQRATYPTVYTPVVNPNASDIEPAPTSVAGRTYVNSQSFGIGFIDTLKLTRWLFLSGGVRYDYFATTAQTAGVSTTALSAVVCQQGALSYVCDRIDKRPNYRASAVFKPSSSGSVYFDWGTSFNPSAESLSLSGNNATQPPQTNETYEAGVKWAFLHDRLNINSAYFQTTKDNVYETDPNNSSNVIPVGNQRVRGAQFGALGHMPRNFDLIVGYAYLDGRIIDSIQNYSPFAAFYKAGDPVFGLAPYIISAKGNPFANVPKNSFNAWVTHALPWRFVGGFGANEVSARRASSTGPTALPLTSAPTPVTQLPVQYKVVPGYWVFNAMLQRPISDRLSFQANLNNLTNAFFIDQPHPSHLIPSESISAQFGLNYRY